MYFLSLTRKSRWVEENVSTFLVLNVRSAGSIWARGNTRILEVHINVQRPDYTKKNNTGIVFNSCWELHKWHRLSIRLFVIIQECCSASRVSRLRWGRLVINAFSPLRWTVRPETFESTWLFINMLSARHQAYCWWERVSPELLRLFTVQRQAGECVRQQGRGVLLRELLPHALREKVRRMPEG